MNPGLKKPKNEQIQARTKTNPRSKQHRYTETLEECQIRKDRNFLTHKKIEAFLPTKTDRSFLTHQKKIEAFLPKKNEP
jgi:hypothetical protein